MLKSNNLSVLIIEHDPVFGSKLNDWVTPSVKDVTLANTAQKGHSFLLSKQPHIIFLDQKLSHYKENNLIAFTKSVFPDAAVICLSNAENVNELAVAKQQGADYLMKRRDLKKPDIDNVLDAAIRSTNKKLPLWHFFKFIKPKHPPVHRKQVAIVEDDELFSFHLTWLLDQSENNPIIDSFSSAQPFYSYCEMTKPDIVFLDYFLPDTNGEEILKFIKDVSPKSIVNVISGQDSTDTAFKLNAMGIENYIVKNPEWKSNFKNLMAKLDL
ncbi:response regulator [Limibacter armeniacum]|uniref:response regulator n=1 Tax=Limibacter armeniacum TaxID=466084 RepID=UPI002FE698E4